MRRAARTDANQAEIIAALKRVGVSVEYIKQPFDLVVFNHKKGEMSFLEVKTAEGRFTKAQLDFISRWPGKILVARTPEEAIRAVLGEEVFT